jgi:two-component system sensor histidine kinase KdpD
VGLDVHVIGREAAARAEASSGQRLRRPRALPRRRVALGFAIALIGAPLLTWALTHTREQVSPSGALLLFLLLVVAVSAVGGLWPALLAALGGFLLVNWYLTPPLYTWTISDPENVLALLVFLAVAAAMSFFVALAARRAAQATRARAKAETLMRLAGSSSVEVILEGLRRALGLRGAALFHDDDGRWVLEASSGEVPASPEGAGLVVQVDAGHVLAASSSGPRSSEDERMLDAFAKELAASIEHGELEAEAATAEDLAAVSELRASILSSMSHDLRTPLAGIKASATSLLQDDVEWTKDARHELLTTIDEETDRLDRVVGSLLDMSRLQAGAVVAHKEVVVVDEVLAEALAGLGGRAQGVVVDIPEDTPPALGDEALLERALANIIANAVAFSRGSPVLVQAGRVRDEVDIRIADRGPGVPLAERDRIFLPFQRLGDTQRREGVGLGLAIARGFVEAMGGTIEADDTPGGGLTIVVRLRAAT